MSEKSSTAYIKDRIENKFSMRFHDRRPFNHEKKKLLKIWLIIS